MNFAINFDKKYDYIYDGGTIEYIFNLPQVLDNIINLLKPGGIFCSVTCNNNFSGHGFYQFSPELFFASFAPKYGMEIIELYLAKVGSDYNDWIRIEKKDFYSHNGRIEFKFGDGEMVYILTIAKKMDYENRKSLILEPPQQNSYENIEWLS